jgi:hypothetical protein
MYQVQKKAAVSLAGVAAIVIGFVGLITLFASALVGVAVIMLAIIIDLAGRRKYDTLVCPACKHDIRL